MIQYHISFIILLPEQSQSFLTTALVTKEHLILFKIVCVPLYLLCWPIVNHRHHLPLILCTEVHPTRTPEQTTVVLTDQANSRSVYYRREILDIVN